MAKLSFLKSVRTRKVWLKTTNTMTSTLRKRNWNFQTLTSSTGGPLHRFSTWKWMTFSNNLNTWWLMSQLVRWITTCSSSPSMRIETTLNKMIIGCFRCRMTQVLFWACSTLMNAFWKLRDRCNRSWRNPWRGVRVSLNRHQSLWFSNQVKHRKTFCNMSMSIRN